MARMPPPLPRALIPHPHVRCDPTVLSGSPHVAGSRVPVRRLWAWHRGGTSVETLFRRYPSLGPGKVLDALAFAYDNAELIQADLEREQLMLDASETKAPGGVPISQLALPFSATSPGAQAAKPARRRR
jgi:uncharacterized protein (DUF433 family)